MDGVIVPGGFGHRGVEGKMEGIKFAREGGLPFLGLCLGLQCAVIEFSRNVCGLKGANSAEFDGSTPYPVIDLMESQKGVKVKGGSMRLGAYDCRLRATSTAQQAYLRDVISERHRHRYEVNNRFRDQLGNGGMTFSGTSPNDELVEIVELSQHPFFVATQFHPELKSRPNRAHPLFRDFIGCCLKRAREGASG
jgi:CTP synthase